MKHVPLLPHPSKLLTSENGFAWDVAVPFDPSRYDAKTIISMVRLVNRRGRVRWFQQLSDADGTEEYLWKPTPAADRIKGVDELLPFVTEMLVRRTGKWDEFYGDSGQLVVSFEDRTDARAFARDLALLRVMPKRKARSRT